MTDKTSHNWSNAKKFEYCWIELLRHRQKNFDGEDVDKCLELLLYYLDDMPNSTRMEFENKHLSISAELADILSTVIDNNWNAMEFVTNNLLQILNKSSTCQIPAKTTISLSKYLMSTLVSCSLEKQEIILEMMKTRTYKDLINATQKNIPKKSKIEKNTFQDQINNDCDGDNFNMNDLLGVDGFLRFKERVIDEVKIVHMIINLIFKSIESASEQMNTKEDTTIIDIIKSICDNFQYLPQEETTKRIWLDLLFKIIMKCFNYQSYKLKPVYEQMSSFIQEFIKTEIDNDNNLMINYQLMAIFLSMIHNTCKNKTEYTNRSLEPLQNFEEKIIQLIINLMGTNQKHMGLDLFCLVLKINKCKKVYELQNRKQHKRMAELKRNIPCHHRPIPGKYKRTNCVLENIILQTIGAVDIKCQKNAINAFNNWSICCCNININSFKILTEICKKKTKLIPMILSLLKRHFYLLFKNDNECGFCLEKLIVSESFPNEIISFYKTGLESLPTKRILEHILKVFNYFLYSLQTRIVFEVIWPIFFLLKKQKLLEFSIEKNVSNRNNMILCLKIFSKYLCKKQAVKLFIDKQLIEDLTSNLIINIYFNKVVCEILTKIVNGLVQLKEDYSFLIEQIIGYILTNCYYTTQILFSFMKAKITNDEMYINENEIFKNIDKNPFTNLENVNHILDMGIVLWNTILNLAQINKVNALIEEKFYQAETIFIIIRKALILVLKASKEKNILNEHVMKSLQNEFFHINLNLYEIKDNCDKYILKEKCDSNGTIYISTFKNTFDKDGHERVSVLIGNNDIYNWELVLEKMEMHIQNSTEDSLHKVLHENVTKFYKEPVDGKDLSIIESLKNTTLYRISNIIMSFVNSYSRPETPVLTKIQKVVNEISKIEISEETKEKVGKHFELVFGYFAMITSKDKLDTAMIPALLEIKNVILHQSPQNLVTTQSARTVTRTLKSILKVIEFRSINTSMSISLNSIYSEGELSESSDSDKSEDSDDDDSFKSAMDSFHDYDADNELFESYIQNEYTEENRKDDYNLNAKFLKEDSYKECVLKIVLDILFNLSTKCVNEPTIWAFNVVSIINRIKVFKLLICEESEHIIIGFKDILQSSDPRLLELQKGVLDLVSFCDHQSLNSYLNLFSAPKPPVELLLEHLYQSSVDEISIEPSFVIDFPNHIDGTFKIYCDSSLMKTFNTLREYHTKHSLQTAYTRAAIMAPLSPIHFRPWTRHGFTISTWINFNDSVGFDPALNSTTTSKVLDGQGDQMFNKFHIVSVGSNELTLSFFCDYENVIHVQMIRPNASISTITQPNISLLQKSAMKKTISFSNLFKMGLGKVVNRNFYVNSMYAFDHKLDKNKWHHLAFSVAILQDKITVIMSANGSNQQFVHIPFESGSDLAKVCNSVLCVGDTVKDLSDRRLQYSLSNVVLFKQAIPELYVLASLMSLGPDYSNFRKCQIGNTVPVLSFIDPKTFSSNIFQHSMNESVKRLRENVVLSYTAQKSMFIQTFNQNDEFLTLGFVAYGKCLSVRRIHTFPSILLLSGGLDILLFVFARVVELNADPYLQSLALKILLKMAHGNNHLYTEFVRKNYLSVINSVLKSPQCIKSVFMLESFVNIAFDLPVLEINDNYHNITDNDSCLIYPAMITSIINNYHVWVEDSEKSNGKLKTLEIMFDVLISLNSKKSKHINYEQLIFVDLAGCLINFCKIHLTGLSSELELNESVAKKLVELLSIYGHTPPRASVIDEIAKLLLMIHEPSSLFINQDRKKFYYCLSGSQPDKIKSGQVSKTAKAFSKRIKNFQQKHLPLFRTVSSSKRRGYSLHSLQNKFQRRGINEDVEFPKLQTNVYEDVCRTGSVNKGMNDTHYKITFIHIKKLLRKIHNRQVMKNKRKITRRKPLSLEFRGKKAENSYKSDDLWINNTSKNNPNQIPSSVKFIQIELLKYLQDLMILLPDNILNDVTEHFLTIDLLTVLANNFDHSIRCEIINLLFQICERLSISKINVLLKMYSFHHFANQIVVYPVALNIVEACKKWVIIDEKANFDTTKASLKAQIGLIILISILPSLVDKYENTFSSCIQLIGKIYEKNLEMKVFLIKTGLIIPSLVKCWAKLYSKRPFLSHNQRPGSVIIFLTYHLCKRSFMSIESYDTIKNMIWDLLNSLEYVANTSLSMSVRQGMRIVQSKVLYVLLQQCTQTYEPPRKYLWGIRRIQTKTVIYIKNSKTVTEMKQNFNQLMQFSVQFIQSMDSQYVPRYAEENLVKTIIQLGLAAKIKIGSIISWSLSPFRSTELKLFIIKCLTHLMKSKHCNTYGVNISIIRIFIKKLADDLKFGCDETNADQLNVVLKLAKFLNTDNNIDTWAIFKAMSKIDEISCDIKEERCNAVEESIHKYEAMVLACIKTSLNMTRVFVEAQNAERRNCINQIRNNKGCNFEWKSLIERMTHENAPFFNKRYHLISWEIDETECPNRARLRMKRSALQINVNFLLPEHREAHKQVSDLQPLQFLINANLKSRNSITDQVLYNFGVFQIKGDWEISGDLVITESIISFFPDDLEKEPIVIVLSNVIEIWLRRYLHLEKGIEIFLSSGQTLLFVFLELNDRKTFEKYFCDKIFDFSSNKWQYFVLQQWREGQLTNWEYLTLLNQLGGRSFQDVTQYPIFPWILADYESSVLDLNQPSSYRKLNRPIAVQHDECKENYEESYELLANNCMQNVSHFPYHFACAYSNSGTVLGYLIRIQPYTKMFIKYQDNHFDLADRSFFSINHAWKLSSKESTTDVKELIPEFYSLPEMFENSEGYDFGVCQNGERVHHVNLPPWSNFSNRLFVFVMRQALESNFVKANIKDWIDLIFGYKQVGPEAILATNVFHSATYSAYAHATTNDVLDKLAYETMIKTYGQIPKQLFTQSHPKPLNIENNITLDESPVSVNYPIKGLKWGKITGSPQLRHVSKVQSYQVGANIRNLVAYNLTNTVYQLTEFTNYMQGYEMDTINCVSWNHPDGIVRISRLGTEKISCLFENNTPDSITCCGSDILSNQLFFGYASGRIVVYQYSDNMPERVNKIRYLQNSYLANSMSYNSASRILGTSKRSGEGTKYFQDVDKLKWKIPVLLICHKDEIVDIKICNEFRIAVSISRSLAVIWDTNTLEFVRQIEPPNVCFELPIILVAISPTLGDIVTIHREEAMDINAMSLDVEDDTSYEVTESNMEDFNVITMNLAGKTLMRLHTVNAKYINHVVIKEKVLSICYSHVKEGIGINLITTGLENGIVKMWSSWDLSFIREIDTKSSDIIDLCFSTNEHLILLTKDATLQVWESPGLLGNPPKFPQIDFKSS